jgi:hypothetical protein
MPATPAHQSRKPATGLGNIDCQHGGRIHNQPGQFFKLSGPESVVVRIAIALSN